MPLRAQVILFVGRVQPLKAPDVLIKSVAELVRAEPARRERLQLIIIGSPSGPESDWARTLPVLAAELGVADLVDFRPHSARSELFRWYCASDLVGVPSYNESFGLVALEAQAAGTPVVAAAVGGLTVAVSGGVSGLLVDGHDPQTWADALASVVLDPGRRDSMAQAASLHAAQFSWDVTVDGLLGSYARALLESREAASPPVLGAVAR